MIEFKMTTDLDAALPTEIGFNFEEQKAYLQERLQHYNNLIVTEDTIKESKSDRANLSKLRTAIEDRRKAVKKQWNQPYADFEARVKELVRLIDQPIAAIDSQLATFEEKRKAEKMESIEALYQRMVSDSIKDIIPLTRIMDQRWLNATMSMNKVEEALLGIVKRTHADMIALDAVEDGYKAAVRAKYVETLDIEAATKHREALQKAAEAFQAREAEKQEAEHQPEPEPAVEATSAPAEQVERIYILKLEMHLTLNQSKALKKFLVTNGISFHKI